MKFLDLMACRVLQSVIQDTINSLYRAEGVKNIVDLSSEILERFGSIIMNKSIEDTSGVGIDFVWAYTSMVILIMVCYIVRFQDSTEGVFWCSNQFLNL